MHKKSTEREGGFLQKQKRHSILTAGEQLCLGFFSIAASAVPAFQMTQILYLQRLCHFCTGTWVQRDGTAKGKGLPVSYT